MGAHVVPVASAFQVPRFSVIGSYSKEPGSRFVKHVALLREESNLVYGSPVRVLEMGPPIVAGDISQSIAGNDPTCSPHVVGWINLSTDERDGIIDWLAEVDKERRPTGPLGFPKTYTVDPAYCWHHDENNVRIYRRFSCIGFVLACYEVGAGITLIEVPTADELPRISLEIIDQMYGPGARERDVLRRGWGIPGEGPWSALLAGYVIHAFDRQDMEIRATPFVVSSFALAEFPGGVGS